MINSIEKIKVTEFLNKSIQENLIKINNKNIKEYKYEIYQKTIYDNIKFISEEKLILKIYVKRDEYFELEKLLKQQIYNKDFIKYDNDHLNFVMMIEEDFFEIKKNKISKCINYSISLDQTKNNIYKYVHFNLILKTDD